MTCRRKTLPYPKKVHEAKFLSRKNRFLVECRYRERKIRAHLPNPGRLRELFLPGRTILLTAEEQTRLRKTAWTVAGVRRGAETVMLHTHYTNTAARWLLENKLVKGLEQYGVIRSEVPWEGSRFDFLLGRGRGNLLVEVKSCTLFEGRVAMFPDAVTARGRRHVLELAALARKGIRTCVLFVVHSSKARIFLPDYHTDPDFAEALYRCRNELLIRAVGVHWKRDLALQRQALLIPVEWNLYRREACGGGSYLVVLRMRRTCTISVGSLGTVTFSSGYYVYVGSGKRNLFARVRRHRQGGRKKRWHIDYLREKAEVRDALPIHTADPLECILAGKVKQTADGEVIGFGASDCRCPSHLFYMKEDPMTKEDFISIVMYYRMGRLSPAPKQSQVHGDSGWRRRP